MTLPTDLDDAMRILDENLHDGDKLSLLQHGAVDSHHGLGRFLRNGWKLWDHPSVNPFVRWIHANLGLGHADDMSSVILHRYVAHLKGEPFDLAAHVEHYKAHWRQMKIDPLTQVRIP